MALSIPEVISGKRRSEPIAPKPDTFLPTEGVVFSTSTKPRQENLANQTPSSRDWENELKFSERDPEGIDFPTFDPNLD